MTEQSAERSEMMAALIWWGAALAAALVVFFGFQLMDGTDPAAGLVFGGVAFVVVGLVMVFRGPGPKADEGIDAGHHAVSHHDHDHAPAAVPEPVAVAPVSEPEPAAPVGLMAMEPVVEAPEAPAAGQSERVRDAARAAGEAARMALGDGVAAVQPAAVAAPADGAGDDLKRVSGIGPKFEEVLHGLGIWSFSQIAEWGPAEVAWIEGNLEGFRGRVMRDDWIGQAKILAAGGETEFSARVDKGDVY